MFQQKIHCVLLKGCHALSDNRRKKFDFPKSCPQSRLSEQILHIRPPNSSMLCLGMLQRKIHSVLLKEYHELFKNRPKKIWFSKSCPHTILSEQFFFTCSHLSQVCCALICSNERSIASCSRSIMNSSKIAQRNFDFPKVVHKADCPSKYFEFHHQNQVCCALIYSNERSIASCAKAITRYHQIAPKKLSLQPLRGS